MSDRLEDCEFKLGRAGTHLKELKRLVNMILEPNSERVPGEFDEASGKYIFKRESMSPALLGSGGGAVIGDVVHNLHACLDYIAWELSNGRGDNRTSFPIYELETDFDKGAAAKMKGIEGSAQALIKRLQPFAGGPRVRHPSRHPLMVLYRLEQRDKHKHLNTTVEVAEMRLGGLPDRIQHSDSMRTLLPGRDNAILATLKLSPDEPRVDVYLDVTRNVAFDPLGPAPREDVIETLIAIDNHIRGVVLPAVRPYLS